MNLVELAWWCKTIGFGSLWLLGIGLLGALINFHKIGSTQWMLEETK